MAEKLDPERLGILIGKIYDAALDPALWEDFMAAGRQLFDARASTFLQLDFRQPARSLVALRGIDPHYEA